MRDLSKNVILSCIALGGVGFVSVSQAQPTQMGAPLLLEFAVTSVPGNSKICGGYDSARKTLMVDHCDKIKTRGDTGLSYFNDATIRSTLTGQCLARAERIHTELIFKDCDQYQDLQKFAFRDKTRQDGTAWPALVPVAGPISGADLNNACLITNYPHPHSNKEVGPSGVYLWACHDSWEYTPNKAIVKQPLLSSQDSRQTMVLEFGIPGMCGGYDATRKKMTVERCEKIVGDAKSTLVYTPNDATITSLADGLCLTRESSTQTESTFSACTAGNEYQRFAFDSHGEGWPVLVPTKGPVSGTVTRLGDSCMITDGLAGTAGPSNLYFWACRASWEYTPNKAVKMRLVADCGNKNEVGPDGTCLVVTPPTLSEAKGYMPVRMKLFIGDMDTQHCVVARMSWLAEWVRAGDCYANETTVTGEERRLSSFVLAVLDNSANPVVEIMTATEKGHDNMCFEAAWNPDTGRADVRRQICDGSDAQRWTLQPTGAYQRYQLRSNFTPQGMGPQCMDASDSPLLELKDCRVSHGATWELGKQY